MTRKIARNHMLKSLLLAIAVLLHAALSPSWVLADGEDWPQFQRNALNTGVTGSRAPIDAPREAWSAFTHYRATHGIDVTPVTANGMVFVIDVDGYAWAFDADEGSVVWSTELEGDPRFKLATPACGDDKVFFATDKGYIYALDRATGNTLWSGRLTQGSGQQAELSTQITYDNGKVYVGSWEGKYYCLDADGDGGSPLVDWIYHVEGARYDWYSGAAVIEDYVLFGNTDGLLTCLNNTSGALVDSCDPATEFGVPSNSIRSAISTNDDGDRIYLTSKNGYVFAIGFDSVSGLFDPSSGWFADIDDYSTSTPVFYDGCIYVCSGGSFYGQEGGLYCFDDATGDQNWFNGLGVTYGSQASPALSIQDGDPYVYISTGEPESAVVCIDAAGTLLWKHVPTYTEYSLQGVSIYGGRVFFGNDAGYLFALETAPAWDVNRDGQVNVFDMVLVGNHFGETGTPGWIPEDVNSDGVIDVFDIIVIGNHFGE
jgi:outer membrane protein assembly factor BamB